jgi:spore maturation protein CgeB
VTYRYGDFNQLADLIEYWYAHDAEREAVRRRGFERTKQNSTWTVRLGEVFDILRAEGAIA